MRTRCRLFALPLNQTSVVTVTEGVNRSWGFPQEQRAGESGR